MRVAAARVTARAGSFRTRGRCGTQYPSFYSRRSVRRSCPARMACRSRVVDDRPTGAGRRGGRLGRVELVGDGRHLERCERRVVNADVHEPGQRHALGHDRGLKRPKKRHVADHGRWLDAVRLAECGQPACGFTDVPLDRVQPVAAVRDVGRREVLAAGQQVRRRARHQRPQRDLEWPGLRGDADVVRAGGMDVDGIPADAGRVVEVPGPGARLEFD